MILALETEYQTMGWLDLYKSPSNIIFSINEIYFTLCDLVFRKKEEGVNGVD